ncbi:MAG: NAD(P)H-binding protein [Bacteroidota bacterium]
MQVFITGGTGYIGRQVIRDLVAGGCGVRALIRTGSEAKLPRECSSNISIVFGNIEQADSLPGLMNGCDAVIHLPGLIREFPRRGITFRGVQYYGSKNIIDEACRSKVKRFLLMSANGVRSDAPTEYQRTKWMAEEYLRQSSLEWTIFRPSVVFGNENEGYENFVEVLINQLRMMPLVVPVPGNGRFLFQPVSINNLSEGFLKSLQQRVGIRKIYEIGGIERLSYVEMLDIVAGPLNIRKWKVHQPIPILRVLARMLGRYSFFPITEDQIIMLLEGNVTEQEGEFFEDFKIKPIRFSDVMRLSLASIA